MLLPGCAAAEDQGSAGASPGRGAWPGDDGEGHPPPNALLGAHSKDGKGSGANVASK